MQKVNGRMPSDGKSSHCLQQVELKINITMYIQCRHSPLSSQPHANRKCEIFSESKLNQKCHKTEIKLQTYAYICTCTFHQRVDQIWYGKHRLYGNGEPK